MIHSKSELLELHHVESGSVGYIQYAVSNQYVGFVCSNLHVKNCYFAIVLEIPSSDSHKMVSVHLDSSTDSDALLCDPFG